MVKPNMELTYQIFEGLGRLLRSGSITILRLRRFFQCICRLCCFRACGSVLAYWSFCPQLYPLCRRHTDKGLLGSEQLVWTKRMRRRAFNLHPERQGCGIDWLVEFFSEAVVGTCAKVSGPYESHDDIIALQKIFIVLSGLLF